jgi:hypothetical protein
MLIIGVVGLSLGSVTVTSPRYGFSFLFLFLFLFLASFFYFIRCLTFESFGRNMCNILMAVRAGSNYCCLYMMDVIVR